MRAMRLSSALNSVALNLFLVPARHWATPSLGRLLLSLLLVWMMVCQTVVPLEAKRTQAKPRTESTSSSELVRDYNDDLPDQLQAPATSSIFGGTSYLSRLEALLTPPATTRIAVVRHAPSINGGGRIEGSIRQLTGENVALNGGAVIKEDLQVPGTPTVVLNGNPTFGGTIQGAGNSQPANYQVILNGGATTLGQLVTRTDPISLSSIPMPPAATGTRSVTVNAPGQSVGNFATLRDLTLNGNAGMFAVPPGTYRNFIANAGSGFIFGISGSSQPSTYNLSSLKLNGQSRIQIAGPVKLTLGNGLVLNASMGSVSNPAWLDLQVAAGGVILNGGSSLYAFVKAPAGAIIINGNAQLTGTVACDRLTLNGGGLLRLTESALPPVNQPPLVSAGPNQTITLPSAAVLNCSVTDDGLPQGSSVALIWIKLSGPGNVNFADANNATTAANFSQPGTYVLRLTASDSQLSSTSDITITVTASHTAPIADFVAPQSSGTAGAFVIAPVGSTAVAQLLDNDITTLWTTPNLNNQFATFQFFDQEMIFIDRVRLQAANGVVSSATLRDFEVQISSTTAENIGFVTVLTATLLNTGQLQEFVFPRGPARARYIRLLLKNNYGSPGNVQLATFNPVAVGSADNIVSLPGQTNTALSQSPSLLANGAAIYDSSYPGGAVSPNGLLGYNNGGWFPRASANPFAIIQLAGDKLYTLSGVKLATAWDLGYGDATAVRNFEVWVSATKPDNASFTKVLTATAAFSGHLQTFSFPGGPLPARYVKYVPLTNAGGATINTQAFDVIAEGVAQVLSSSGQNQNVLNPAEAAFDSDADSIWFSPDNVATNVSVKTALADGVTHNIYGVRINPVNDFTYGQRGPKDFEIRVSTATADDSAFTTVYSGTLASTFDGGSQEFLFPNLVAARYVEFFWKNGYSTPDIGVRTLEVLAAPSRGAALVGFSSQEQAASSVLDLDPGNQWVTAFNNPTNQWLKLLLRNADLSSINHIALRPAIAANGNFSAPKDFELQISTTDSADGSFTTVLAGTLANSTQLQDFYFLPVPARYVRLLLKNNYGGGRFGLASFLVYSTDQIGSTTRFLDRSTDADGSVVAWYWDFGDGITSSEQNPTHTFAVAGDYTVSLTVTDNNGLTSTRQVSYHVLASLSPDFSYSPIISHEGGEAVRFTDTQRLPAQANAARRYSFGDGTGLSQAISSAVHTFKDNGVFHVTLNVGDPLGISFVTSRDIVVLNMPPTVDLDPGQTIVWGEQWTSVPRISDQSLVDAASLQGDWDFGDGQTSQCVNCTDANATVTHAFSNPGTYSVGLSVTDKDGDVGSDSATYIVNQRNTSLTFLANSLQGSGQTVLSRVKLSDSFANTGIPNRLIEFHLNGTVGNALTNASGIAEIALPLPPATNVAVVMATWAGDELYLTSNKTASATLNFAPAVNAGPDQAITMPCVVTLNGSLSDDGLPGGVALNQSWTIISGPGNVSFANSDTAQTTATFSASGKYVLRLTASDSQLTSSDDVTVTANAIEVGVTQYFGPTPYLGSADSLLIGRNTNYFYLEDFEDHLLNTPGVSASAGGVSSLVFGPDLHDSVDADDGLIDGSGVNGDSYFTANGMAGITFTFDAAALGSLPTHAGLVWTDGAGEVFFEAFDRAGVSMGRRGPYNFPDGVNNGTTAEDNFLGAYNRDGISAIRILNTSGGLEIDHLQYGFSTANGAPVVIAGPDQVANLAVNSLSLQGIVSDDGLPACTMVSTSWSVVSGPGPVSFTDPHALSTTATPSVAGIYVLRLTASDSQLDGSDDVAITMNDGTINRPPTVAAGADQAITLPDSVVALNAVVADDGQPAGSTATVVWTVLEGPGNVTFGDFHLTETTASFSLPGTYLLRITASDSTLLASDDLFVTVNPETTNQPPTANAGADQTATIHANLLVNPGAEANAVDGEIPGWIEVEGAGWTCSSSIPGTDFPAAQRGNAYFFAGDVPRAELRQDVDLSGYASNIAAGTQQFEFKAYLRSLAEVAPDAGRVILEYRNTDNTNVIATLDSGLITATTGWHLTENTRTVPIGTGWIRVRLVATRSSGTTNDAFFDSISLRPIGNAAVKLEGLVADDGLPNGSSLSTSWETVSGPASVDFADSSAAITGVSFASPGTYLLRFTTTDGSLSASDDVTVVVYPANQPPLVNAGEDQIIMLPEVATLQGIVEDDGLPADNDLSISWSRMSGPGTVTFANAASAITSADFSTAGIYSLRLTVDDTEYSATADIRITVNPAVMNEPPSVNAGEDQAITLPTNIVILNGAATDDGLPAESLLSVAWTQVSGPGAVIFDNASSAFTTAQFIAVGSYVLRLTAGDSALSASDDVVITVASPLQSNQAPTVNAGTDQTILLSQEAQLDGSAGDDGLPVGSNLTATWTMLSGPGTVTFLNSGVTVTGADFSAGGTYVLRLTATDGSLSTSDDLTITVNDDVPPPTVEITSPTAASSVTQPTQVIGSVGSGDWQLEYSLASDDNSNNRIWTTFASGVGSVTNGSLGTFDPTMMLNGLFTIRLSATDSYGQISHTSIEVIVEKDLKIGNFTISFSDLNLPVAGVPMEVTRTYDSRDKRVGDFGFGWALGLKNVRLEKSRVLGFDWYETVSQDVFANYCLQATSAHVVTVTFPGGKVFKFQAVVSPNCQRLSPITTGALSFTPMPGTHGTLEVMGSADFQLEGSIPGPVNLLGLGSGVDIFNSSLFKYTAEDGTAYVIDQRSGLQSIRDTNNNMVTVTAAGIFHSNGQSISFARDNLGRITSVTDPAGNAQTYTYDANGDLVSYTDNEHHTSAYSYDATHRLLTIQDPRGIQPIRNDYDADGRLISHTDGFGKVVAYNHDLATRVETVTDRLGHQTNFAYDDRGNVLSKTDARGGVTTFTYDANDNVLSETNALGKTTTYTYDANDHRTSISDPLGNVTQFTYNALGRVLASTSPMGQVTTNTYNAAGNLLTTTDALNNTTSFSYNAFDGQRTSMTDPLNNTTRYDYIDGYLTKETDALGHETTFTYDSNGNRASQAITRTNAQGQLEAITTNYDYDKLNRLRKTTYDDGSFTQIEYNLIGQQAATIDQLGNRTAFSYDDMGRLARLDFPDGTHEQTSYDAEGRRLASTDRGGHETFSTYDELGRITRATYADGSFTQTVYDSAGRISSTIDALGNTTTFDYDPNCGCSARRSRITDALGHSTAFSYDGNGNQVSTSDALGHTTSYEYDAGNRHTKTTYADGTSDTVVYDGLGRAVSKTDQGGKTTRFSYDALGRLGSVTDALNQETSYGYNELGQQISQTDANHHTTTFEYDRLGRRLKRMLPAGQFETYSYDNGGNLRSRTDFNGKTTTFTYDVMRRLLSTIPDGSLNQATLSFSYNATGQRATMNDASGTTQYSYDVRNRLASKQTPFGTLSYAYDDGGKLVATRSANAHGVNVNYSYDSLNRLAAVKDNNLTALNGGVTNYTYDDAGNLQSYRYPNDVTTSYVYNSRNRLTNLTVSTTVSAVASYSYALGPAGNRTAVRELGGRTVNYSYDDLYRLTSESIANDPQAINGSISYNHDPVGNRLARSSTVAAVSSQSSSYDADDRLTSAGYDNNGNTVSVGSENYTYDFENHLTTLNGGSVRYVYDGDGNRVAKTAGGLTTNYLVDTNNPTGYAQVVDELQGGAVVRSFTYGHDLISQRIVGSSLSFYQYDGHGSVRLLTDATGAVTDTYDYDAFGNLISRTGATPNDYLYSGEQFDANLGFYYLRARYMDPDAGTFQTIDDNEGQPFDQKSLHKYLYAGSDPINKRDPSGRSFLVFESIGAATELGIRGSGGISGATVLGLIKFLLIGIATTTITATTVEVAKRSQLPIRVNHYTTWAVLGLIAASNAIANPNPSGRNYFTPDLYVFGETARDMLATCKTMEVLVQVNVYLSADGIGPTTTVVERPCTDGRTDPGGGREMSTTQPIPFWTRQPTFYPLF